MRLKEILDELTTTHNLSDEDLLYLITGDYDVSILRKRADEVRLENYGRDVYIRGLIEFTNYCKNGCKYCGINCTNTKADRYRLSADEILQCCHEGFMLGFRTFVLQGGEDPYFSDEVLVPIVKRIREELPECAITLSIGERSEESYRALYEAGANRYLLRHETADETHYGKLHPDSMSLENRKRCLFTLKKIGYQVGSGFMVGSPYQTPENLVSDLRFLQELEPDMIGIGPFISHEQTEFSGFDNGSVETTLRLISILRLMFPYALIPATTALGTLAADGRERGLKAGANVVMPNLSPVGIRDKYSLYDNKICTGEESAQCVACLTGRVKVAGYEVVVNRGDVKRRT